MVPYYVTMTITEQDLGLLKHSGYHSFLLRYWQNRDAQDGTWLLSLENPITREIKVFRTVESLIDYLTQLNPKTQVNLNS
jgi:hypothetical protein